MDEAVRSDDRKELVPEVGEQCDALLGRIAPRSFGMMVARKPKTRPKAQ